MKSATTTELGLENVEAAARRISSLVHRTPLLSSRIISERAGLEVRLKCENLQRSGSFKIRGATNAMRSLSAIDRRKGVIAYSSGNHAQAVALAARDAGVSATIVMPPDSMPSKLAATAAYGARIVTQDVTTANRREVAEKLAEKTGAVLIPPFDHPHIIAGAGTAALEILEDWPDVRTIITPLGGGGLLAGTALAARRSPGVVIVGSEPLAGNDGQRSLQSGQIVTIAPPATIADGARTTAVGDLNFQIIRESVADIITVDDATLLEITRFAISRTKLLIEPTGALGLAALLSSANPAIQGPVAVIISGGNVDLERLSG
ncbi:MAG: pyridoxal-phosphate dependent enzyme [Acidobacteria bacterium]|nr:pyridoxal-phosphate dependent enzyme [Acidobacteriota bacterium]